MTIEFEWVDSNQRLVDLCAQWRQQQAIALDTEFIRSRTFFPEIGLLQVADQQGNYLIDPLAISDKQALQACLTDKRVTKVIHSCSEDLDVFQRYLSIVPSPLFDTQIAAAFAGHGASISYANLVKQIQGQEIPKQETRSDWLQRPLSQSQLEYATLDVLHLLAIYRQLKASLRSKQRLSWLEADCQRIVEIKAEQENLGEYYLKIKSAWKLNPQQLAVLQHLCQWREQHVRKLNIPRGRLVKDGCLWEMAYRLPQNRSQLSRIKELHPRFIEKYGQPCLQIIQDTAEQSMPLPALPAPLNVQEMSLFKTLKSLVVELAENLSMPPELLARKKDIEFLVRHAQAEGSITLPHSLQNWRRDIVGGPLLKQLMKIIDQDLRGDCSS
ncbi:MAG: ribonuclease D [Pseudomonadota bacterium]